VFSADVAGLASQATYFVRARAVNSAGTTWSNVSTFTTRQFIPATVVINEMHYNPDLSTDAVEFIELHNAGDEAVALEGWRFSEGIEYTFPAGTMLPAGGYVVVAENPAELLAKYGAVNHTDRDNLPPADAKAPALPINYLPKHPFHHGHPDLRDEVAVSGVWENRDERTIRNELGREFACSENIDIQIGRVLDKLKAMGELDNTYIVYTADHGMAIGRHGLQGKQNLYEHTWRVPLIVKGPGIKPGSRAQGNIYLQDILATLCDLTSVAPPESNEGTSIKPVLEGKQAVVRDVLYGVYNGGTKPGMRSVKKGDWKLIKYDVLDGKVRETQLFNIAENPNEFVKEHHDPQVIAQTGITPAANQVNLAGDPRYADKLQEMEELLLAEMRRLNDPWRLWNQPDDGLKPPADAPKAKGKQRQGKK